MYCASVEAGMLAIRLPEDIERRLAALAAATGRTKSFYARQAILEHIGDLEDIYLAEQRLIDAREGRSATIPLAKVMAAHGLED
jgi:RHH-type transcriptional regulator, rel operon repressor / antitoxin RelB